MEAGTATRQRSQEHGKCLFQPIFLKNLAEAQGWERKVCREEAAAASIRRSCLQSPAGRGKGVGMLGLGVGKGADLGSRGSGICPGPGLLGEEKQASLKLPASSAGSRSAPCHWALPTCLGTSHPGIEMLADPALWEPCTVIQESVVARKRRDPTLGDLDQGLGLRAISIISGLVSVTQCGPSAQKNLPSLLMCL